MIDQEKPKQLKDSVVRITREGEQVGVLFAPPSRAEPDKHIAIEDVMRTMKNLKPGKYEAVDQKGNSWNVYNKDLCEGMDDV